MNGRHLFLVGEYPDRARILDGLALDDVGARPEGASHSIYEELWHVAGWQDVVLSGEDARFEAWMQGPKYPPRRHPRDAKEWNELVARFLQGAERAALEAEESPQLDLELGPDLTYRDALAALAVHNAYHLGKIVALRQALGSWNVL